MLGALLPGFQEAYQRGLQQKQQRLTFQQSQQSDNIAGDALRQQFAPSATGGASPGGQQPQALPPGGPTPPPVQQTPGMPQIVPPGQGSQPGMPMQGPMPSVGGGGREGGSQGGAQYGPPPAPRPQPMAPAGQAMKGPMPQQGPMPMNQDSPMGRAQPSMASGAGQDSPMGRAQPPAAPPPSARPQLSRPHAGEGAPPPSNVMEQAKKVALQSGAGGVEKFMAAQGYPRNGNWCGEFAAAVVKSVGGTPPKDPQIASNWRNYGQADKGPNVGDVAVRKGKPTGSTGSHVTFVDGVDPKTGTFTGVGGNQGGGRATESKFSSSEYDFRKTGETFARGANGDKKAEAAVNSTPEGQAAMAQAKDGTLDIRSSVRAILSTHPNASGGEILRAMEKMQPFMTLDSQAQARKLQEEWHEETIKERISHDRATELQAKENAANRQEHQDDIERDKKASRDAAAQRDKEKVEADKEKKETKAQELKDKEDKEYREDLNGLATRITGKETALANLGSGDQELSKSMKEELKELNAAYRALKAEGKPSTRSAGKGRDSEAKKPPLPESTKKELQGLDYSDPKVKDYIKHLGEQYDLGS